MLILFAASVLVYFVTGIKGRFTRWQRFYFAVGTFIIVYLVTMVLVFFGGEP